MSPLLFCFAIAALSLFSPIIGWNALVVIGGFAALSASSIIVRSLMCGQTPARLCLQQLKAYVSPVSSEGRNLIAWSTVALGLNFAVVFILVAWSCGTPQTILQNYDSAFHYSVVRHIVETSNASPIGAGSVMGSETAVYPDLWHAICALIYVSGVNEMMPSVWVAIIVVVGCFASLCLCAFVRAIMSKPSGLVMLLCMLSPVVFRYSVFGFVPNGSLLSNMLGLALLPAAIAWFSSEFQAGCLTCGLGRKFLIVMACVFATGMAHPNTVFVLLIFALCLMCARVRRFRVKAAWIGFGVGIWFFCLSSPLFQRAVNCLDRVDSDIEWGEYLLSSMHLDYAFFDDSVVLPVLLALVVFLVFCLLAFLLRRVVPGSWIVAGIGFLVADAVLVLFPCNPVSVALTGFWYRDFARFVIMACYLAEPALIVCCTCAIIRPCKASQQREGRGRSRAQCGKQVHGAAHALIVFGLVVYCALGIHESLALQQGLALVSANAPSYSNMNISPSQEEFSRKVAETVGDAGVLNNCNDGSVFLYSLYGVNAALKGRAANQMDPMSDDLCFVIENIDKAGGDDDFAFAVREALERLGIEYVVKMSDSANTTMKMNELKQIDYASANAICSVNGETSGFTLVLEQDGMQLLRIG